MPWESMLVGVDGSPEAADAASLAQRLSRITGAECQLVHAVRDLWAPLTALGDAARAREARRLQLAVARGMVNESLRAHVAPQLLQTLEVRFGRAAAVVARAADEHAAGLIVLGGKRHTMLERWIGGSTSLDVVRASRVPVLVTAGAPPGIRRILVAADLSGAAKPTLELADRVAALTGAQLRVVSVFEPLPTLPDVQPMDPVEYYGLSQELLVRDIWPIVRTAGTEKLIRHGMVVETLLRETADWSADLLIVGSHGKGWAQRILLGSVTERLLNDLPTSLLVAPIGAPVAAARPQAVETAGA